VEIDPAVDEWWMYSVLSMGKNDPKDVRTTVTGKEVVVEYPDAVAPGRHYPFLVYLRLYGEQGVLWEGLI